MIPGSYKLRSQPVTGATGVAALLLGRRFTGCEVDRKFIDIAVRRLVETDVPDPHPE